MRVASRMMAISRGLLMARSPSSDRIEILAAPTCGAAALSFWMNCSSREMRPSHGSFFVAVASAAGSPADASPRTSGRNGV